MKYNFEKQNSLGGIEMKRILLTVLVLLICVNVFAIEEKIITLNTNVGTMDVYLTEKGSLTFYGHVHGINLNETSFSEFRAVLDKFIEWDNIAIKNSVYDLNKSIDNELYHDFFLGFTYVRESNKSHLKMLIRQWNDFYGYTLDSYEVKRLRAVMSEESLEKYKEKIQIRKKQTDLFN